METYNVNGRTMFRTVLVRRGRYKVLERFMETQESAEQDAAHLAVGEFKGARVLQVYPVGAERGPERLGTLTIWSP